MSDPTPPSAPADEPGATSGRAADAPAPPRWAAMLSLLLGGFAILWLGLGLVVLLDSEDASAGARAMKLVLSACVPISLVGLLLGFAGRSAGSRAGATGAGLSLLVLLSAAGLAVLSYWSRLT